MELTTDVVYRLNQQNEITFVNDEWNVFAVANDGVHLVRDKVLSRKLWDYISDPATGQLYVNLLKRVRAGRTTQYNYRCDSPSLRRFMTMDVTPLPDGGVEFRTRPVRLEPRDPQALLDSKTPRSDRLIEACGWCRKIRVGNEWLEVEAAVPALKLFEQDPMPMMTHGLCEACDRMMGDTLKDE